MRASACRKLALTTAERELIESLESTRSSTSRSSRPWASTSFRNEEAAEVLMNEIDPIVQKTLVD